MMLKAFRFGLALICRLPSAVHSPSMLKNALVLQILDLMQQPGNNHEAIANSIHREKLAVHPRVKAGVNGIQNH